MISILYHRASTTAMMAAFDALIYQKVPTCREEIWQRLWGGCGSAPALERNKL